MLTFTCSLCVCVLSRAYVVIVLHAQAAGVLIGVGDMAGLVIKAPVACVCVLSRACVIVVLHAQAVGVLIGVGGMAGLVGRVVSRAPKYSLFDPAKEMVSELRVVCEWWCGYQ